MNPVWEQAKDIFFKAISLAPDERARFVEQECSCDPKLYEEVSSLLASYRDDSFLETPANRSIVETLLFQGPKLADGQILGHYRIVGQIGSGGMGEVYLAEDERLGRKVAIKILSTKLSSHLANVERFTREAKAASALNHPNILVVHEIGESDGFRYIVSEYVDGKTLREVLRQKALSIPTILDISIQIAGALAAAHAARIVHRDIKPENIMVRPDGFVKVLDFGLAKLMSGGPVLSGPNDVTQLRNQTSRGVILGTVNYMSPEQAKGEAVDERTDIFSLGVLMYEMAAGRTPFEGESISDTFANLIKSDPLPLSQAAADVPGRLDEIVHRSLIKKPDDRYQKILDVLADLKVLRDDVAFDQRLERSISSGKLPRTSQSLTGNAAGALGSISRGNRSRSIILSLIAVLLIAGSIGIYYWSSTRTTATGGRKTLAILPFVNSGKDPSVEYLSDGITDNVINNLVQVSGLKVTPRNSSFRYKEDQSDLPAIASKLGVENVVTGDIKQLGDKLVVNVQLIDAKDDTTIWGNQFVRASNDILAVQSEIANEVVRNLRVKLTKNEEQLLRKRYTDNSEAYNLYLKGLYSWNKHTLAEVLKSIEYFNQALEKDPNYALAYSGLSAAYGMMGNHYLPPREAFPKAKAYAAKAIELDDSLVEAHGAMAANDLYYDWDWNAAEREIKRAEELDPNPAQIFLLEGDLREIKGRFEEANALRKRSLEVDPLSPQYNFVAGATPYFEGKTDDAIEQLEETAKLEPNYSMTYQFLGQAYEQKGMYAKAIETFEKGMTRAGEDSPELVACIGHAYAMQGDRERAEKALADLRQMSGRSYFSPYWFAVVYAGLNDRKSALEWLEKAFADRSSLLIWLNVDPTFRPLRGDAEFQDLVRRIGL